MALTQEQIQELKKQLAEQIKNLPEEQKSSAQSQIDSMSSEALETMLKQQQEQVKIFRKIISKEIPSKIIKENDDAIAVLEIRPISKGHSLIIPKNEIKDAKELSPKTIELSQEISKEIQKKLNPKSIEIQTENKFGEIIINIIPIYDEKLDIFSDRMESTESELDKTYQEIIKEEKKSEKSEKKKEIPSEIVKLKRRIP
jgi:histidine triad (HIT) family protein|tara:strand:+ start:504 stop:1103 length:600 start_codon:yes stop_codon:yes gene_type:complete